YIINFYVDPNHSYSLYKSRNSIFEVETLKYLYYSVIFLLYMVVKLELLDQNRSAILPVDS
ncbi:MAG TPA: hypothetical protein VFP25_03670, partial [Nitrososphaeraceae archaeon]|nr:hypothetical protein [Nitrososphaeraceae archaeon]